MAFTRSWDSSYEAVPATGDNLNEGAGVIRNEKLDTRERAQVDHHWSTLASDTDTGYHRKLTLVGQTDPTAVASTAILFFDSADSKIKAIFADGTIIEFASTAGHFADTISEQTSATGVTIDGVLLKDSQVKTDTIIEKTAAAGVTADSVLLKDGGVSGAGVIAMTDTTDASSSTTGAVKTAGGLGVAKKVYIGTALDVGTTAHVAGAATLDSTLAVTGASTLTGGLTTGDATILFKDVDIGDWNMNAAATVTVAHGVTLSKIRSIIVIIRDDADTSYYAIPDFTTAGVGEAYISLIDATNITIQRVTGSKFQSVDFNSTSFNRGTVALWYTA